MSDDDIMKVFISHKSQNQISEDFQNLQNCGCILVIKIKISLIQNIKILFTQWQKNISVYCRIYILCKK